MIVLVQIKLDEMIGGAIIGAILGGLIGVVMMLIKVLKFRIELSKDRLHVVEEKSNPKIRIQHRLDLSFESVQSITIEKSKNDSHNKPIKSSKRLQPYIVFKLKTGTEARINVNFYSKEQIIHIIDIVLKYNKEVSDTFEHKTGKELVALSLIKE